MIFVFEKSLRLLCGECTGGHEQRGSGEAREEAYAEMVVNYNWSVTRADEDTFGGFQGFWTWHLSGCSP